MIVSTDYLTNVYDVARFQRTADSCLRAAEAMLMFYGVDSIAFTGTSGAAMAYILSNMMGIPLICVRKPNESSHYAASGRGLIEGNVNANRYMIVDDFIASGNTILNIVNAVGNRMPEAELVGIILYNRAPSERGADMHLLPGREVPILACRPEENRLW